MINKKIRDYIEKSAMMAAGRHLFDAPMVMASVKGAHSKASHKRRLRINKHSGRKL